MSAPALRADEREGRRPGGGSATRTAVRVLGAVAAFAGAEHGLGELTQPDPDHGALVIESWPHVGAFEPLNGEPAMTVIPDVGAAGAITVLVSLFLGWWAVRSHGVRRDGWVLLGFAALLLLVGGGFGPPLVAGALGVALLRPAPAGRTGLGRRWRPLLALTAGAFLALVPGVVLLGWLGWSGTLWLAAALPFLAFTGLLLTLVAVRADQAAGPRGHVTVAGPGTGAGQQPAK